MESVFPSVLPLKLRMLDAPNWIIALIMTGIPGFLNATVCPAVSFLSDRHRSKLGRRIPFILYTIPFLCVFLALIGWAGPLAKSLAASGLIGDPQMAALVMIGLFTIGFQFFNMFVASVYYYLFNDVVPKQFLGRFLAAFRVVGTLASSSFYFFVFPFAETHFTWIFTGASVLYGVVFLLMCRFVKEGEYPPPPTIESRSQSRAIAGVKTYFVECFSQRFYWLFYLWVGFNAAAGTIMTFQVFFAQSVGMDLKQFGQFTGASNILIAILLIPCGILSDRVHPVRLMRVASLLVAVSSFAPAVFLFFEVRQEISFLVWCVSYGLAVPLTALYFAAEFPSYMRLLPQERYGQFCSANAMIRSLFTMAGGLLGGVFLDLAKNLCARPEDAFRLIPLWLAAFQLISAFCFWILYSEWKRGGGRTHYVPPSRSHHTASV